MDFLQFNNQNIISKDQTTSFIYKLTHGTAKIIDFHQKAVKSIQAPFFLNIVQCLYSVTSLKTIQAVGKCQIKKITIKESHKLFIKELKERGVRKSKFKIFEEIHSSKFYELVRLGVILQIRKGENFVSKDQHYYFMVSGSIIAFQKESCLNMFRLEEGSTWCSGQSNAIFKSEVDQAKFIEVSCNIVYCILHDKEKELIELAKFQSQTNQAFKLRNERVDEVIKSSKEKHFAKLVIAKNFDNSKGFRYQHNSNLSKWMRAKTCYLKENGEFKKPAELIEEIKKENTQKFMELMQINKSKLKRNQLFCKSMDKLYSLSSTLTPDSCQPSKCQISNSPGHQSRDSLKNNSVNYNRAQFVQAVSQILNLKQHSNLRKKTFSRNKAKMKFPMGKIRQNSSKILVRWKVS